MDRKITRSTCFVVELSYPSSLFVIEYILSLCIKIWRSSANICDFHQKDMVLVRDDILASIILVFFRRIREIY